MKEFEVTVRVRNNLLVQRREELGMTQAKFAQAVGMAAGDVSALECLRHSPVNSRGEWKPSARRIAEFHGIAPAELWPDAVLGVAASVAVQKLGATEMHRLVAPTVRLRALPPTTTETLVCDDPSPDVIVGAGEDLGWLRSALETLPYREAEILRRRFGLDGVEPQTLEEVAEFFGRSRERIRSLETRALRSLREEHARCETPFERTVRLVEGDPDVLCGPMRPLRMDRADVPDQR